MLMVSSSTRVEGLWKRDEEGNTMFFEMKARNPGALLAILLACLWSNLVLVIYSGMGL
jgi:hypothetical protein